MDQLLQLLSEETPQGPQPLFAEVILPLYLPRTLTYQVPFHLKDSLQVGQRIEVPLQRNKRYVGLVHRFPVPAPQGYQAKPIVELVDETPLVLPSQLKLWEWISEYYLCTLGEVMQAAMPAGLKLSSETLLSLNPAFDAESWESLQLPGKIYTALQALKEKPELSLGELQNLTGQKNLSQTLKEMRELNIVQLKEEIQERYKPRYEGMVRLVPELLSQPQAMQEAFSRLSKRAGRQIEALLALVQLSKKQERISRREVYEAAKCDIGVLKKLEERGLAELYDEEISRLKAYEGEVHGHFELSDTQKRALQEIEQHFTDKGVVLLHGLTGSGKTQIFVELMRQCIERGEQVLYLLPEIALTAQIVGRLQRQFGDQVVVYHSKFNPNERVEAWQASLQGRPIVLGARSAIFLPFEKLGLIVVDEEHDPSYKQQDPAPRYNARDAAVFLGHLHGAKVLLGSATPSLESLQNAQSGKFGLVRLWERFGGLDLPQILIADAAEERRNKTMKSHFTPQLLKALEKTLANGEQAILFQNRRGYAPMYECAACGWRAGCHQCDVSLTYHKYSNDLHCHYCGHQERLPKVCPACRSTDLLIQGFGTEKIEDELQIYLPDARIARMDLDTIKGKNGHETLIERFEQGEIQILVGTQMVTKGLDFEHVGLVGVLSADQMLHFPDFRATERAFQLMMQVSGRAGRKNKRGLVVIQAMRPSHPVLKEVQHNHFEEFLSREMLERADFQYPPFVRLIRVQLRHTKPEVVEQAAEFFAKRLQLRYEGRVLGPGSPGVGRVRGYYLMDILLKLPKQNAYLKGAKDYLLECQEALKTQRGLSSVRILFDVDPY